MRQSNNLGFSLVELLVALSILAIITAIALPAYNDSTMKGRRADAQSALVDAASKMEAYFYTNRTYTTDLTDLGYSSASGVDTPEGYYTLSVNAPTAACPIASCYELQATAGSAQADDGDLTLDSLGRRLPSDLW